MKVTLSQYNALKARIFAHCGYVEDWCIFPLYDQSDKFWSLEGEDYGDTLHYADTEEALARGTGNYYESMVTRNRHLPKSVYRGSELTLVLCDPQTDGNRWLQICDNAKERP